MQRRIRWQKVIPYLLLLVVVTALFTIVMVNHIRQGELERWQGQLFRTAQLLKSNLETNYDLQGHHNLNFPEAAKANSDVLALDVTYLDLNGHILGTSISTNQQHQSELIMPALEQTIKDGQASHFEKDVLAVAVTFNDPNGTPTGIIQLQAPTSYFQMHLSQFLGLALAVLIICSVGVLLLNVIIQDLSRKPVETLNIAVRQMSMGNFSNLDFPKSPRELSALSRTLQVMSQELGKQITELTSERAKLSAVLNQMTDGVLIVDANDRVQLLNPASERLFQIEEETGLGRSVVEVIRYHQLIDLWREAKKGQRQSLMLEIGAQHLFLQVVAIPLKTALPGSTMLLFQDLTQLRRLETVRRDFISNVSHELRTPLASVKALAETLQEGALEDPPAAHRFILLMETEIDNLTQLVNELLELSRIESGKVPLSFHRVHPCDLLKPAYERMSLQTERAELDLILECQPELPLVFADTDRITQVLINLVHNAIKFTPPHGKITLSAYRDKEVIVFYVRDTGVGIAKKDLSRIFERFYKADQARTGGGTGLGLSIARHMVESHGGYIWAESEEDVGSTFYFTLPVA